MYIERIKTKQGHPVPKSSGYAQGPFPPELFKQPELISNYTPQPDGGHEDMPVGGTAQNNFQPVKWFKCKTCKDIIAQSHLGSHTCGEIDGES